MILQKINSILVETLQVYIFGHYAEWGALLKHELLSNIVETNGDIYILHFAPAVGRVTKIIHQNNKRENNTLLNETRVLKHNEKLLYLFNTIFADSLYNLTFCSARLFIIF